jgi:hypothetical protein
MAKEQRKSGFTRGALPQTGQHPLHLPYAFWIFVMMPKEKAFSAIHPHERTAGSESA